MGSWGDLRLLAEEATHLPWSRAGRLHVARCQLDLGDWDGAAQTRDGLAGDAGGAAGSDPKASRPQSAQGNALESPTALLFSGHRIDPPDRPSIRFPGAEEATARAALHDVVQREKDASPGPLVGLAGGANGGDILFHEVCRELNVPTRLYLAVPPALYVETSVAGASRDWIDRFHRLRREVEVSVLGPSRRLPSWLRCPSDYTVWRRANAWMWHHARALAGPRVTVLVLWDGEAGEGGGTDDMVARAQAGGARLVTLSTREMFPPRPGP